MAETRGEPERLIARGGTELWIKGADDFYDVQHGQEITLVRARDYDALRVERDALKVELRTARKERDSAHEGWEHDQMARAQAERGRDALRTQLAAARELLIEAAIDIEAGVNATYHGPSNVHPALYHKYARDLEITARLMIAALITEAPTDG